jgi:hypothetical protein
VSTAFASTAGKGRLTPALEPGAHRRLVEAAFAIGAIPSSRAAVTRRARSEAERRSRERLDGGPAHNLNRSAGRGARPTPTDHLTSAGAPRPADLPAIPSASHPAPSAAPAHSGDARTANPELTPPAWHTGDVAGVPDGASQPCHTDLSRSPSAHDVSRRAPLARAGLSIPGRESEAARSPVVTSAVSLEQRRCDRPHARTQGGSRSSATRTDRGRRSAPCEAERASSRSLILLRSERSRSLFVHRRRQGRAGVNGVGTTHLRLTAPTNTLSCEREEVIQPQER